MKMKPSHPGEILYEDVMKPLGLSITDAARMLGVSRKTLSGVINGRYRLTTDLAARIAIATSTSVESWINMQAQLDAWTANQHKPRNVSTFDCACHAGV
jgi:antitoxin HigA-1